MFDLSVNRDLKERFDPLRKSPTMKAVVDVYEKRWWPTHDGDALKAHGLGGMKLLSEHIKNLKSPSGSNFDFEEAKSQYLRL